MLSKYAITFATALLVATPVLAAPNGSYRLEVKTKNPWPLAATTSGDKLTLKSRGRTKVIGSTATKSSSDTKIVGKANFSTASCTAKSTVTITLRFSKDGNYKSGSAKGRCVRANGSVNFSGKVVQK